MWLASHNTFSAQSGQ